MSSTSPTSSTGSLRALSVSAMPVHAGQKQRSQRHPSSETSLHKIESISVAPLPASESLTVLRFELAVVMKTTPERRTGAHVPVLAYRSEKQLADFEALHKAFNRAVDVTHLLSKCGFCRAIQSLSVGLVEGQDNIHLTLEQFISNILGLLVPLRRPSDKRICYGKMQCWCFLTRFLLPQTEE